MKKALKFLLTLTFLFIIFSGYAQSGHNNRDGSNCLYKSNRCDNSEGCSVCYACAEERNKKRIARIAEDKKSYEASVAAEAKRKADIIAGQKAKTEAAVRRDNIAMAQLASAEKNLENFDQLRQQQRARRAEIENKYRQQENAKNKEYETYLSKIQEAQTTGNAAGTEEEFWNETVAVSNFEPVEDPKTRLWGYKTKQGKMVMDFKYRMAKPFSKGVAFVYEKDNWQLINNHNEVQRTLDKGYFESLITSGAKITGISSIESFTDGLAVVNFYLSPYSTKGSWGVLDAKGNLAISPVFYEIKSFKNGTAQASRYVSNDEYKFENGYIGEFQAFFTYLEVGLIDRKGNWVQPPQKKMEYNYKHYVPLYLEVVNTKERDKYTSDEWEAIIKENKLKQKQANAKSMQELEAEVDRRVNAAKSQGMLVENK